MKSINILDKKNKDLYTKKTFTDIGYTTLLNYTKSLAKEYYTRTEYPFKLGIILGIPMLKYAQLISSKLSLLERITSYGQILGIKLIEVELDNGSTITLNLEGDTNGK